MQCTGGLFMPNDISRNFSVRILEGLEGFDNTVKVEWLENDPRLMRLLEPLAFTDARGIIWPVDRGDIIDGASIPRFCWRIVGSPFIGMYRRASVIHDIYCGLKTRPWQQVHQCFYEMMLFDGVPRLKADLMYKFVHRLGPRWECAE